MRCSLYLIFSLVTLVGTVKCENKFESLKANRSKRFFQNLNSYFSRPIENTVDVSKTEVYKIKFANRTSSDYLCDDSEKQNCNISISKFDRSINDFTPATYLTPPTVSQKNYSSYIDNNFDQIFSNGYGYYPENDIQSKPTTSAPSNDNPNKNGYYYKPPSNGNGYYPENDIQSKPTTSAPSNDNPNKNGYYYKPPSNGNGYYPENDIQSKPTTLAPFNDNPNKNGYYYKPPSNGNGYYPENDIQSKPTTSAPSNDNPNQNGYYYKPPSNGNGYYPENDIQSKPTTLAPSNDNPNQNGYYYKPPSNGNGYYPENDIQNKPTTSAPSNDNPNQNGYYYKPPSNSNGYYPENDIQNKPTTSAPSNDNPNKNGYYYKPPSNGNGYYSTEFEPLNVKIKDMMCIKSSRNGRFSVGMTTLKSIQVPPVIENKYTNENLPQCSVNTLDSNTFQINIQEPDMINCGVHYCDSDVETNLMCLTLRFPVIAGIKTGEDVIMRIQCRPQPQVASHVKQLKLKSSQISSNTGKSLPLLATVSGGTSNSELRSQMGLYAMTKLGFTQLVGNNDIVELGQDLQIRSLIKQGDGWYFSRLGKVLVQKTNSPNSNGNSHGENTNSVLVLADDGCVNPRMKAICPLGPFNDPGNPLISLLNIRMFVFEDMKDGDEIAMSVTVFGCIHYEDCYPEDNMCQEWQLPNRFRRSVKEKDSNISDSTTKIKFRVQMSSTKNRIINCNNKECKNVSEASWKKPIIVLLFILFCSFALFIIYLINLYSNFEHPMLMRVPNM